MVDVCALEPCVTFHERGRACNEHLANVTLP